MTQQPPPIADQAVPRNHAEDSQAPGPSPTSPAAYGAHLLAASRPNRPWRSCVCSCVTIARRTLGAVLGVVGAVWVGQGTQLIHGSSMTGSTFWAIVGALCVIAGLGLLSWPWRQSHTHP